MEMESERPRARFVTFGCKVNQYDTQVIRERVLAAGVTETDGPADVIVVNTCTVTENGGAQARKAVRRLARENPDARIYLTGCYAVSDPEAAAALPNVAGVIGNERKGDLVRILGGEPLAKPFIEESVTGLDGHTRAFLKVEDGCRLCCSFCIIPSVRPDVTSKNADTVVGEVRGLVGAGHREVILTGVHLGAWGTDRGEGRGALPALVRRILEETDLPRLRLSSIEANEVTDELIDLYADHPRMAPHLHLPLQSGSRNVLARMRRRYNPTQFLRTVGRIRERIPGCALSTDVIVGFPGETEDDFAATRRVMREAGFMKTHVFPFSPRRGTPAAEMGGQVHSAEIRRRVRSAESTGLSLAREFATARLGARARALIETRRVRGWLTGFTGRYLRVFVEGPDDLMGRLVDVRLTELANDGVRAEIIEHV